MKHRVIRSVVLSATLLLTPFIEAQAPEPAAIRQLIRVDGTRRINLTCMGKGSPVIVFESGFGGGSAGWRSVQTMLSASAKTCTYDRAGMGYSDGSTRPATADNVVDDLHLLIRSARIGPPIILVGHSRGGLYSTLYALRYKSDVAAMVLVDPSFAQQNSENGAVSKSEKDYVAGQLDPQRARFIRCEGLARAKAISASNPQDCFSVSSSASPAVREETEYQGLRPEYYRALLSEFNLTMADVGYSKIVEQESKSRYPLGNLPLIVLTSGTPIQRNSPNATDNAAVEAVWKHGHDRLAGYSSKGRSIVVPGSSHAIQEDQPQAVVDAIKTVMRELPHPDLH